MARAQSASPNDVRALALAGSTEDAKSLMLGKSREVRAMAVAALDSLLEINGRGADASKAGAQATYESARLWIIGAILISVVLGLGLAIIIARVVATAVRAHARCRAARCW